VRDFIVLTGTSLFCPDPRLRSRHSLPWANFFLA
jgi:hypothetical protein